MDQDKIQRQQSIKLIVSETIMVLAVIITVVVLAFLVSGYWINSNFEVERQGMLQIYSIPTGANVNVDGESSWLQRTNTSKVLPGGEHVVALTKDGYDSWTKTINISEGLLYKIHYPRLFLQERESEKVYNTANIVIASVSPDRNKMMVFDEASKCFILNLEDEKIRSKEIDVAKIFSNNNGVAFDANNITEMSWSKDNNHVLLHDNGTNEWIVLDVDNPTNSVNLTKQFGTTFDVIKMLNDSASNLLALQNGNLHKIDVQAKQISAILAEKVISFDYYGNEVIMITRTDAGDVANCLKLSNGEIVKLGKIDLSYKVVIGKFYDKKYIAIIGDGRLDLYSREDFELASSYELSFTPMIAKVGHGGEFIEMFAENKVATLDMETMDVVEWEMPSNSYGWLDDNMIYSVDNGDLLVFDYDGLNKRKLAKDVLANKPVTITDNKWLYYYSGDYLVREWLIPR